MMSKHLFGVNTEGTSEDKYKKHGTDAQYNCSHSNKYI